MTTSHHGAALSLKIRSITQLAEDINSYELVSMCGGPLPPFEAGAHIGLHLPGGLVRNYSLLNSQAERHRYVIAVAKDPGSRGGSRWMHEAARVGDTIAADAPRNRFPLTETAAHSVFIAGGIGITPLWSMIQRLQALGRSWQLFYAARTRQRAALLDDLTALRGNGAQRLQVTFDQEPGGKRLDIAAIVTAQSADTHLYCCGPAPMLEAFEQATASRSSSTVHLEYFAPRETHDKQNAFTVVLEKSGLTITIPSGKSILEVLIEAGVPVPYACTDGVCGTCETAVLEGTPDHRDVVLGNEEKQSNKVMMVCCSRSQTEKLVLDL